MNSDNAFKLISDEITRIAPVFDSLKGSSAAVCRYRGAWDGLVWSDELPAGSHEEPLTICYLVKFRTSLLVEQPIEQLRSCWELAKQSFPNWPGFLSERCVPSAELVKLVEKGREEVDEFLNDSQA